MPLRHIFLLLAVWNCWTLRSLSAADRRLANWPGFAPDGIEFDRDGRICGAIGAAHRSLQLDEPGKIVRREGARFSTRSVQCPADAAIDTEGNLHVTEIDGMRIQKFIRRP
jgi:sugar lactone lactonase YvrE